MRVLSLMLVLLLIGCTSDRPSMEPSGDKMPADAAAALKEAPEWELFSLNPCIEEDPDDASRFHGWKILGSTRITDATTRQQLLQSLEESVAANPGIVAACFSPRHGIRVKYKEQQHDFVICFECYQARWYTDDERQDGFNPTNTPADAFNRLLTEAKVPCLSHLLFKLQLDFILN
ncbi:hypothetical protein [Gimesia sp.]|uniref:hypothetical protein n=1 Tax=Gimesia sp. TaxID=2024833 RepID=UPI003A8D0339